MCQHAEANHKYMKYYDKCKESLYHKYWDVNNFYWWEMLQKLPVDDFEWVGNTSHFNKGFLKSYNDDTDKGYFFEFHFQYPKTSHGLYNDFPVLSERIKIEKVGKALANLYNKTEYVVHKRNLKQP